MLPLTLPFPLSFYGKSYSTAQVSANGLVGLRPGAWFTPRRLREGTA